MLIIQKVYLLPCTIGVFQNKLFNEQPNSSIFQRIPNANDTKKKKKKIANLMNW